MTKKNKIQGSRKKKAYMKPELKEHSNIKSRPAEIFSSCGLSGG